MEASREINISAEPLMIDVKDLNHVDGTRVSIHEVNNIESYDDADEKNVQEIAPSTSAGYFREALDSSKSTKSIEHTNNSYRTQTNTTMNIQELEQLNSTTQSENILQLSEVDMKSDPYAIFFEQNRSDLELLEEIIRDDLEEMEKKKNKRKREDNNFDSSNGTKQYTTNEIVPATTDLYSQHNSQTKCLIDYPEPELDWIIQLDSNLWQPTEPDMKNMSLSSFVQLYDFDINETFSIFGNETNINEMNNFESSEDDKVSNPKKSMPTISTSDGSHIANNEEKNIQTKIILNDEEQDKVQLDEIKESEHSPIQTTNKKMLEVSELALMRDHSYANVRQVCQYIQKETRMDEVNLFKSENEKNSLKERLPTTFTVQRNDKITLEPFTDKPEVSIIQNKTKKLVTLEKENSLSSLTDLILGLKISDPVASCTALLDLIRGREVINLSTIKEYTKNKTMPEEWVAAGVIVRSQKKARKNTNQCFTWSLSDLKENFKITSLSLFGQTSKEFCNIPVGTVITVVNPKVIYIPRSSLAVTCLSVDNPGKIMILGKSKDFGICKTQDKSGLRCPAVVNLSQSEYCRFHRKHEYETLSRGQDLQFGNKDKEKNHTILHSLHLDTYGSNSALQKMPTKINVIQSKTRNETKDLINIKDKKKLNIRSIEMLDISDKNIGRKRLHINEDFQQQELVNVVKIRKILKILPIPKTLVKQKDDNHCFEFEKMQDMGKKMVNYMLTSKAIICPTCKYINFLAGQFCINGNHPLKVQDTIKNIFKCLTCYQNTAYHLYPIHPCPGCGGVRWEKQ